MHEPESERGDQSFDCIGGELSFALPKSLQQLGIDADQAGQPSIWNPRHSYRTPQITKETWPDRGRTNPADAGHCAVAVLIFRSCFIPPSLPLNIGQ